MKFANEDVAYSPNCELATFSGRVTGNGVASRIGVPCSVVHSLFEKKVLVTEYAVKIAELGHHQLVVYRMGSKGTYVTSAWLMPTLAPRVAMDVLVSASAASWHTASQGSQGTGNY